MERLKQLGHDVLTAFEAGDANQGIPDELVLGYATFHERAVLTKNERDFLRLDRRTPAHRGIIVCTESLDFEDLGDRIHESIRRNEPLAGKLVRVVRPNLTTRQTCA